MYILTLLIVKNIKQNTEIETEISIIDNLSAAKCLFKIEQDILKNNLKKYIKNNYKSMSAREEKYLVREYTKLNIENEFVIDINNTTFYLKLTKTDMGCTRIVKFHSTKKGIQ